MMKAHLISKARAKVVADAGGVIGVWTKLADSPKEFAENIKAMVDAVLQGFTPDEIGKVGGGNFCGVFDKATACRA